VAERGLAQPRRPEDQHVVHGLAASPGGFDVDGQLLADRLLAEVVVEALGADRGLRGRVLAGRAGGDDAVVTHAAMFSRPPPGWEPRGAPQCGEGSPAGAACTPCGMPVMSGSRWAMPLWQSMQVACPVAR